MLAEDIRAKHSIINIGNSTILQADLTLERQQEDSKDNIDIQITEQLSSQISSPHETNRNQQVRDRCDNY